MLTVASGWPLFWAIIGGGAVVVALLSAAVGSPRWFRHGQARPSLTPVRHAGGHEVTDHRTAA